MHKIFIIFTFTIGVAIVALLSTTAAPAQTCPEPSASCQTPDGWTITLVSGAPAFNSGACPDQWEYTYEVCKPGTGGDTGVPCDSKGLSHVNFAIPDCCPDKITLEQIGNDTLAIFPVGQGDPTTYFELGDLFVYVAKFTLQKSADHKWSFCADTDVTNETSVGLKVKSALEGCKILAPACLPPPNQPNFTSQTITQSGYKFDILYDSAGKSYDVVCPDVSCTVTTVNINKIKLYHEGDPIATVTWLPYDTPIQSAASPGCTYVRIRSGVVKKVCD